ncbi:MAG: carboxyl-terminal processing protease [Gammaproteobacteria bacterium]|jgi:carboxyl-terminal processing protease
MRKELTVIVLCLFGVYQHSLADDQIKAAEATTDVRKAASEIIPLDDIRILVEVFHKIKKDYVEPISDETLLEEAVRGMLAGLDPHSSYLDEDSYLSLQEGTTGEFGGLGIEVGMEDGFLKVIAPIDDTPAQRAGVQAGDIIVRLNDTPIKGIGLADSVKMMRGKSGTEIRISVLREGEDKPLEFKILRAVIQIQSVKSKFLEAGFGYIRISHFQSRTGNDVQKHVRDLIKKDSKLNGLVLDLRNNPGGVLGAAVAVSDTFLKEGRIVYTQGRAQDSQLEFDAKPPDLIDGAPLIVLVNEGSASASEIVAGALQDRQRAIIMGRRSFGKGSVQTILPMSNNSALKLTTARYFTPSGRSIQAEGIIPDIEIEKVTLSRTNNPTTGFVKESNLSGHLENSDDGNSADKSAVAESRLLAESDFELYEALNLLKGMHLMRLRSASNQ